VSTAFSDGMTRITESFTLLAVSSGLNDDDGKISISVQM